MEIITEPETNEMTRDEWIAEFVGRTGATHEDTNRRDNGAAVRFRFSNGFVAEWRWQDLSPAEAIGEARAANKIPDNVRPR